MVGHQKIVHCVQKETVVRSKRMSVCPPVPSSSPTHVHRGDRPSLGCGVAADGIPKRRRAKARVYTPKSQAMELQSQTLSSFFRPSSSRSSEKTPTRISNSSSLYELSSTMESDFESDSALVSTPGTSTELEMEQEIDTQPIEPSTRNQKKGWMHQSSESESDGKMRRGPSCVKFNERE